MTRRRRLAAWLVGPLMMAVGYVIFGPGGIILGGAIGTVYAIRAMFP